jgi:hypothetical protein
LESSPDHTASLARLEKLAPRFLELAQQDPQDPVALDALVQVVNTEL